MVTIHTAQDFIHALREDPDLLDQVRQAIMTDEVLALPKQFAELLQTQNRILAELAESRQTQADIQATQSKILADQEESRQTQATIQETQNELLADRDETRRTLAAILQNQAAMQDTIVTLLQTQNRILADQEVSRKSQENMGDDIRALHTDIRALHGMYRQQHEDFGRFRGNYAIDAARDNDYMIINPIMRALGMRGKPRYRRLREADRDSILTQNFEAIDALGLSESVWETFMRPDLIVQITERGSDEPGFYVAMEASYTADAKDKRRAVEHAKVLRTTGWDAYAVVASVRLGPSVADTLIRTVKEFIEFGDEESALWFWLEEERLEPLPPC